MRIAILFTLASSSLASAQTFTIDFNNLTPGMTLSSQYATSNGVQFVPNAFSGPNDNNTAEPWATNTGLTVSDYVPLDPDRPGYAVGTPMLFEGNLIRTIDDYLNEDGDASVLTTFATPITTATVTFVGIVFGESGARDTQLIALDAGNNVLARTRAEARDTTNQQNLTVNVPAGFTRLAIVPGNYNDTVGFDNLVYTLATPNVPSWNVDADGLYWNAANWTSGNIPAGINATARFGPVITQPRTVTLNDTVALNRIIFDSAQPYTVAGTNNIFILGGTDNELNVVQGAHDVRVGVNSSSSIKKTGTGSLAIRKLTVAANVAVNEGTLTLSGGTAIASKVGSVSVSDGAQFSLGQTPLIATTMPLNDVRLLVQSGKLNVGSPSALRIGYALGDTLSFTTIGGENIPSTATVIRATLAGDADLDLDVDFDDLLSLAQNYGISPTAKTWRQGDFSYNSVVDFDDLLLLAQNYGSSAHTSAQLASLDSDFASDFRLARSLVPEPAVAAAFVVLIPTRRRRK